MILAYAALVTRVEKARLAPRGLALPVGTAEVCSYLDEPALAGQAP